MKSKISSIVALIISFILILSMFTACSIKNKENEDSTSTLAPGDEWQPGDDAYQPVEVTGVELVQIVSKALGDEASGFNGDLNSLSKEQVEKVKEVAEKEGYVIEENEAGDTVIKKEPVYTTVPSSEVVSNILSEADVSNVTNLSDEEYSKVSQIAEENSVTAVTDSKGNLEIFKTTIPQTTRKVTTTKTNQTDSSSTTESIIGYSIPTVTPTTTKKVDNGKDKTNASTTERTTAPKTSAVGYNYLSTFGGASHIIFNSSDVTTDGVVVAGNSFVNNEGKAIGDCGGIIAKFDASGNLLWKDVLTGNDSVYFEDVTVLPDGSAIAVGQTMSTDIASASEYKCSGTYEAIMVKYSAKGTRQWVKLFGGSSTDSASCIDSASDGSYVIGGKTYSKDFNCKTLPNNTQNAYIAKYDSNGNLLWSTGFGGSRAAETTDVCISNAGYVYATLQTVNTDGSFSDSSAPENKRHSYVMRFSPEGALEWKKDYYESGSVKFESITNANDSGCVVAGTYSVSNDGNKYSFKSFYNGGNRGTGDGIVLKINSVGEQQWVVPMVGYENDHITDITPVSGGYAVCGYTTSTNRDFAFTNYGDNDSFVYVIHEYGTLLTYASFGGSESDRAMAICGSGTTVYTVGATASGDNFFSKAQYKGDADKTAAFVVKYTLEQ